MGFSMGEPMGMRERAELDSHLTAGPPERSDDPADWLREWVEAGRPSHDCDTEGVVFDEEERIVFCGVCGAEL